MQAYTAVTNCVYRMLSTALNRNWTDTMSKNYDALCKRGSDGCRITLGKSAASSLQATLVSKEHACGACWCCTGVTDGATMDDGGAFMLHAGGMGEAVLTRAEAEAERGEKKGVKRKNPAAAAPDQVCMCMPAPTFLSGGGRAPLHGRAAPGG